MDHSGLVVLGVAGAVEEGQRPFVGEVDELLQELSLLRPVQLRPVATAELVPAFWFVALGLRPPLVLGSALLCLGLPLLLLLRPATPLAGVVAVMAVLGLPNGMLNLGLQALLFRTAAAAEMGAASGLFQTCRYVGSVLSTSLLGVAFAGGVSSPALHALAIALAAISLLLLGGSLIRLARPDVAGPVGAA